VSDNILFRHASTSHGDYVVGGNSSSRDSPAHVSSDLGAVLGFNLVQRATNRGATQCSDASANCRARARVAHGVAYNRTHACAT
jgi:hypothetical protein